jgi:uncharacterized protein (DUF488 family)
MTGLKFTEAYERRLASFGATKIAKALEDIAREHQAGKLALLCFGPAVTECHRGDFARWGPGQTGEDIAEIR